MVEILIAVIVLSFGMLGMAGTTAMVVRQTTIADLTTKRAAAFQTVAERIRSMPFDSVATGSETVGAYAISWESTPINAGRAKTVSIVTSGPGLRSSANAEDGTPPAIDAHATDTLEFRVLK